MNWVELLDAALFALMFKRFLFHHSENFGDYHWSTAVTPSIVDTISRTKFPHAKSFSQEWKQNVEIAQSCNIPTHMVRNVTRLIAF